MANYWTVRCPDEEGKNNVGLWKTWFNEGCVAFGWDPALGFRWDGTGNEDSDFETGRRSALKMEVGDVVIPCLPNRRFGPPGEIFRLALEDKQWQPTGSNTKDPARPGLGRRIYVDWWAAPPPGNVAAPGTWSDIPVPTIQSVKPDRFHRFEQMIGDPSNWVPYDPEDTQWPNLAASVLGGELEAAVAETARELLERRAGFQSDPKVRKIVDRYAMGRAKEWLEEEGYEEIEDTSANKPYDFKCIKGGCRFSVEVKGTQTDGKSVIVTANEVEHASRQGESMMVVVHSIRLSGKDASGGCIRVWNPWNPSSLDLKPLQYQWNCPSE